MTVSITDRSGPSVTVVSHASMVNRNDVAPVANSVAEDPMKDCVCECDRGHEECDRDTKAARGAPARIQFEHCSAPLLP